MNSTQYLEAPNSRVSADKAQKRPAHILVIRLSAMGDVAMTVPVLRIFRAQYPEVRITVVTRESFAPLFAHMEGVQVHVAEVTSRHRGIVGIWRLFGELKGLNIHVVADLHQVIRSNILKCLFDFRGIKVVQLDKGRAEKKALTRATHKVFKPLKSMHQRYADVFAKLGFPLDLSKELCRERVSLTPKVLALTGNHPKKWIGIAPFAKYTAKTYPLDQMTQVIAKIQAQEKVHVFLFGGGKKEGDRLEGIAKSYPNVTNVVGQLPFEEELVLMANLDLMLAMDSGNGHLAACYGVPVVTVWGVTHPYAGFMAYGQPMDQSILPDLKRYNRIPTSVYGNKVPRGYKNVIHTIDPQSIVAKVLEMIS